MTRAPDRTRPFAAREALEGALSDALATPEFKAAIASFSSEVEAMLVAHSSEKEALLAALVAVTNELYWCRRLFEERPKVLPKDTTVSVKRIVEALETASRIIGPAERSKP